MCDLEDYKSYMKKSVAKIASLTFCTICSSKFPLTSSSTSQAFCEEIFMNKIFMIQEKSQFLDHRNLELYDMLLTKVLQNYSTVKYYTHYHDNA